MLLLVALAPFLLIHGTTADLKRAVNHVVTGLDNVTRSFKYVVFTDPQLGLYDLVHGSDGTNWKYDVDNIEKLGAVVKSMSTKSDEKPDFLICLGDLNNAYPENDPRFKTAGMLSPYRPPQTLDLVHALRNTFESSIPVFMIAGNHDLTEDAKFRHVDSYERVWGNGYYYFWNSGRVFIALETQFFRSKELGTVKLRIKEMKWLRELLEKLPKDAPKTVFQHVALFIEKSDETDSERAGKAIPMEHRNTLLKLFCEYNVQTVYSGHTHFNSFPAPHKCENGRSVRQIVLTALTAQLKWKSDSKVYPIGKPSYLVANVDGKGNTEVDVKELEGEKIDQEKVRLYPRHF